MTTAAQLRVGFIGLGSQGGPMARRIVDGGFPLYLWARRASSVASFADTPAVVVASPAELGSNSDVVCVCVTADSDVEAVVLGEDGVVAGLAPGGLLVLHSTIHPSTCRRIAQVASASDIAVIDAPVSGGGGAAAEGRLTVMVGGRDEDVARAEPVLCTFADPVLHLGPLGSGLAAKLVNNFLFTSQITLAVETFELADELGIDRSALAAVLATGSGGSRAVQILASSHVDLTGLRQAANLLVKDVSLLREVMAAAAADLPEQLDSLATATLRLLTEPVPADSAHVSA